MKVGAGPLSIRMPQCFAGAPAAHAEQDQRAGTGSPTGTLDQEAARGLGENFARAGLAPVAGVGRQRGRLGAVQRAPDAAREAEAIAAGAERAGLMPIGRADPVAGDGDDARGIGGRLAASGSAAFVHDYPRRPSGWPLLASPRFG